MQITTNIATIPLCFLLIVNTGCHHSPENKALASLKKLPPFTLLSIDSSHLVRSQDIPTGRHSIFFYFDPTCEHCQQETQRIISHKGAFKDVQFYFLSSATSRQVDSFYKFYGLDRLSNVFVGIDYQFSFFNAFLPSSVPYMAIYDKRKRLKKVYNGEADIQSLITQTRN